MVGLLRAHAPLLAAILIAVGLAGCADLGTSQDHELRPMSAMEAEAIARRAAQQWQADAQLMMLGTVDGAQGQGVDSPMGMAFPFDAGGPGNLTLDDNDVDGRALHWRAVYRSDSTGTGLSIAVLGNGTIHQESVPDAGPPNPVGEWTIDSVQALALARDDSAFAAASQQGVAMVLVGDFAAAFSSGGAAGNQEPLWYFMVEAEPPVFVAVKARSGQIVDPLAMMREMAEDMAEEQAGQAGFNYTYPGTETDPGGAPRTFYLNGTYNPSEPWDSDSLIFQVGSNRTAIDVHFSWQGPTSVQSAGYTLRESRGDEPQATDHAEDEQMSNGTRSVQVWDTYPATAGTFHATLGEVELSDFEVRIEYQFKITVR